MNGRQILMSKNPEKAKGLEAKVEVLAKEVEANIESLDKILDSINELIGDAQEIMELRIAGRMITCQEKVLSAKKAINEVRMKI